MGREILKGERGEGERGGSERVKGGGGERGEGEKEGKEGEKDSTKDKKIK